MTAKNPVPFPSNPATHVVWIQPGMEGLMELPWNRDTASWASFEPTTFKYTRSRWTYQINYKGIPVVIKRYLVDRALRSYASWFWPSKAKREFKITRGLYSHGLPVPKPLGCLELSKTLRVLASYLITEYVDDAPTILEFINTDPTRVQNTSLFQTVGSTLGQLHSAGVAHEDCSIHNFLVTKTDKSESLEVLAIDLDGSTLHQHISTNRRLKNLTQLTRSLMNHQIELPSESWQAFSEGYLQHSNASCRKQAEQAMQSLLKHLVG